MVLHHLAWMVATVELLPGAAPQGSDVMAYPNVVGALTLMLP